MAARAGNTAAVLSCLAYSFCSISMVLSNKALAANKAPLRILPVVCQCAVAVIFVEGARRTGAVQYDPFHLRTAMRWLPVNVFFVLMLYTSFMALKYVQVPIITVFKNLTNLFIVWGDWHFNSQPVSLLIVASLLVMLLGAAMTGANDVTFEFWGYTWMGLNCLSTAGYVLYMKFATKHIKLSRFGMVFYNNLLSIFIMVPMALAQGEFGVIANRADLHTPAYAGLNIFAGMVGFMLNFASLWCVGATSATTYAIVGSVNKVPTSILGYYFFDSTMTKETMVYITVSIMGGFMYSAAKIMEGREAKKAAGGVHASPVTTNHANGDAEALLPKDPATHHRAQAHAAVAGKV